jgi:hypothetical protein
MRAGGPNLPINIAHVTQKNRSRRHRYRNPSQSDELWRAKPETALGFIRSKIRGDQIIRTSASANIDPGGGGTYQITIGVERFQKAGLVRAGIRLNSRQCIFVYEK